jgi:hypothetical protein
MPKRTIGTLIKAKFQGATREEMNEAYHGKRGQSPAPSLTDDELRAELIVAYGLGETPSPVPPGHTAPVAAPIHAGVARTSPLGKIPNLRQTGPWEGRKHHMIFHKVEQAKQQGAQPLGWNGMIWNVPLDVLVEVPEPYYHSAINTKLWDTGSDDVVTWVQIPGSKGKLEKHTTPTARDTLNFEYRGIVPGTEDLPHDYVDFFQRKARETQMFKGFGRPVLIMIFDLLEVPRRNMSGIAPPEGHAFFRDMRDEDIRISIAQFLGTDYAEMLQNELWEAAVG